MLGVPLPALEIHWSRIETLRKLALLKVRLPTHGWMMGMDALESAMTVKAIKHYRRRAIAAEARIAKVEAALKEMIDEFLCGGANWHPHDATALKTAQALLKEDK